MNQCLFVGHIKRITKQENKITTITLVINNSCKPEIIIPDTLSNIPLSLGMLLGVKGHIDTTNGTNIIADKMSMLDVKDYASAG